MKSLHKKVGAGFATFLFFARLICRCPLRGVEGLVQRWLLRSLLRPANNFPSLSSTPPVQIREKPIPFSPSSTQRRQKGSAKGERERETKKNQNLQHLFSLSFLPIRFLTEFYQERNSILTMLSRSAIRTAARSVVATNAARALNRVVSISVSLIVWGC